MPSTRIQIEQQFFRALNSVVEPTVRRGFFSSRLFPATLLILESTGYVSGKPRSTPLLSFRVGPYLLISTGRGRRSFWVRNLQKEPEVNYILGGRSYPAKAELITGDADKATALHPLMKSLLRPLEVMTSRGWAFALLKKSTR
jgi:deazaflavin-dependent oxidoreductase (nitroreductase family)